MGNAATGRMVKRAMRAAIVIAIITSLSGLVTAEDGAAPTQSDRPGGAAGARVQRSVDEAVAAERARSGSVSPIWRNVERVLGTQFQPTLDDVTTKTAVQLLAAQYRAGVKRDVARAAAEGRSVYEEPAEWRRTEVAVHVDAAGKLIDARVITPSGSSKLDALALDAVRATIAAAPPLTGKRSTARFAIESAVSVMPPEVSAVGASGTVRQNGAALKVARLHFDETTGRVSHPDFILKKTLQTRVKLIGADVY